MSAVENMASTQINDTLAQLRPADVVDNGITNAVDVDKVPQSVADAVPDKATEKPKEATSTVPYYRLFRCVFRHAPCACSDDVLTRNSPAVMLTG